MSTLTPEQVKLIDNAEGNCHETAYEVLELFADKGFKDAQLVQGIVTGQARIEGVKFTHSWLEHRGLVFDFSNGREIIMAANFYYHIGQIELDVCKRYTYEEAYEKLLETGLYEPWGFPTDKELNT